jgi:hypothetical protein
MVVAVTIKSGYALVQIKSVCVCVCVYMILKENLNVGPTNPIVYNLFEVFSSC